MNNNQMRRLEDAEQRAEAIPTEDDPDAGVEFCTIDVVFVETVFEGGEKKEIRLPATYAADVPFRPKFFHQGLKRWQRWRVRYPLEHPNEGPYRDEPEPSVPKTLSADDGKEAEGKGSESGE